MNDQDMIISWILFKCNFWTAEKYLQKIKYVLICTLTKNRQICIFTLICVHLGVMIRERDVAVFVCLSA